MQGKLSSMFNRHQGHARRWMVLFMAIWVVVCASGCQNSYVAEREEFSKAIDKGDIPRVRKMLDADPDLVETMPRMAGFNIWSLAQNDGRMPERVTLIRMLLNAGVDPNEGLSANGYEMGLVDPACLRLFLEFGLSQENKDLALLAVQEGRAVEFEFGRWYPDVSPYKERREAELKNLHVIDALLREFGAGSDLRSPLWNRSSNLSAHRLGPERESRVVWNSPEGPMLVTFLLNQTGSVYWVAVMDQTLHLKRIGAVSNGTPYTLIEVRTHSPKIPAFLRGQWMLAVAQWNSSFDASMPIYFVGKSYRRMPNVMQCTLVQWIGDRPEDIAVGSKAQCEVMRLPERTIYEDINSLNLTRLEDLEIRPAELNSPSAFRFDRIPGVREPENSCGCSKRSTDHGATTQP